METKLERISQLSRENPDMVFTSIGHLINREMLKKCHEEMDKDKAVGIDGVTISVYFIAVYAPTARNLFLFLLAILALESAGSIRFLYRYFLSKI